MDKYFKWKVALIALIIGFSLWKAYPPNEKINLGLDLQGGIQLQLEVLLGEIPEEARDDATDRAVEIIRNRIDEFGVREPVISKQGNNHIVVQLPGVTDRDRAKEIVGKTAHLEFKLVAEDTALIDEAEKGNIPEGYEYKDVQDVLGPSKLLLASKAELSGEHLTNAWVGFGQLGEANVQLQLDKDGAQVFDRVTFQNVGRRLAIVLDGRVHSAPVIRDRIPNGQAVISGNFTVDEASDLSLVLRAGALPAPVEIIEERTVGPSLGMDSIRKGVKAGILGVVFIFLFMPVYYLGLGLLANLGLIFYGAMVIGALAAFQASLTLPGIAGFILSIGMAVDANVLIFERMREEKATGKTARGIVSAGYHKAFAAIMDSNLTTLLTSMILFMFGTGPVKGFAVTLSIGVVASMFAALFINRVILDAILRKKPDFDFRMMNLISNTNISFLKGRVWAYGFSVVVLLIGGLTFFQRGHENYGVEFTGGTLAQVAFKTPVEMTSLRQALEKGGSRGIVLQRYGMKQDNHFIIKTAEADTQNIETTLQNFAAQTEYEILRVDRIGPAVSGDLRKKALMAVGWACLGILIYLGWRFEWKFALAAVAALIHDTVFTFGIYALAGREINIPTVAAILTVIGYSVNDTIVTFDRVRDNLKLMRKMKFQNLVDLSINQTLSRTVLTSGTTLMTALALFILGGPAVNDFAFILIVGFLVGTYSSIFVANALVVDWKAH